MKHVDTRRVSPKAQDALRERVIWTVRRGMSQAQAARVFGVSRRSVNGWHRCWREHGVRALRSHPRGRPSVIRLAPWQAATTVRLITDRCPDQLKLPFALWTREADRDLIASRFDIQLSVWTVGRYLKRWGFTPQKPLRRAFERDPKAVRRWLEEEYPAIRKQAKTEGAEIYWGDEMGLRSDYVVGRSYGRRGKTPVIPGTGQRFGCNMISAITNRGRLNFMVFNRLFRVDVFLDFLKRLVRQAEHKVFLIVDGHPVHRSGKADAWIKKNAHRICLFFLPASR